MGLLDFIFRQAPGAIAGVKRGNRERQELQRKQGFEDQDRARRDAMDAANTQRLLEEYQMKQAEAPLIREERAARIDALKAEAEQRRTPKPPPAPKYALKTARDGRITAVNEDTALDAQGNPVYERIPAGPQAPQTDTFGNALKLRGEFQDLTKNARTIAESYQKVQQAANDPSAAGDLSLIFGYMRLLDPGSTVREGEFANAQNSGSIPQRIQAQYNKALAGERLTQSQRDDFLNQAGGVVQSQRQIISRYQDQYKGVAGKYKIDPGMVIDDPFQGIAEPSAPKAPPQSLADQWEALVKGGMSPAEATAKLNRRKP